MTLVVTAAVGAALALASVAAAAPEMPDWPLPGCDRFTGLCVTTDTIAGVPGGPGGPHRPPPISQNPTIEVVTISTEPGEMVAFRLDGVLLTSAGLRIHGGRAPIPAECLARPVEPMNRAC